MFLWQAVQACVACRPASENVEWLTAPRHCESVGLWHDSHAVGKPAAAWFGLVVRS